MERGGCTASIATGSRSFGPTSTGSGTRCWRASRSERKEDEVAERERAIAAGAGAGIPPVMRTVTVNRPVEEAFRIFTEEIGSWWPLETHSIAASEHEGERIKAETVVMEGKVGGRIYEVMSDGSEAAWGELLVWQPPHRLVLAWQPARHLTEVEVWFTADGEGTRVDLEHRGWDGLGNDALPTTRES